MSISIWALLLCKEFWIFRHHASVGKYLLKFWCAAWLVVGKFIKAQVKIPFKNGLHFSWSFNFFQCCIFIFPTFPRLDPEMKSLYDSSWNEVDSCSSFNIINNSVLHWKMIHLNLWQKAGDWRAIENRKIFCQNLQYMKS